MKLKSTRDLVYLTRDSLKPIGEVCFTDYVFNQVLYCLFKPILYNYKILALRYIFLQRKGGHILCFSKRKHSSFSPSTYRKYLLCTIHLVIPKRVNCACKHNCITRSKNVGKSYGFHMGLAWQHAVGFSWVCQAKLRALQVQACLRFQAKDLGRDCACGCPMVDVVSF